MIWTDDADRLLITLWNKGASLKSIGAEMREAGYDYTRNAIAGRKHRLPDKAFDYRVSPKKTTTRNARRPQRSKPVDAKPKKPPLNDSPPPAPVEPPFDLSTWEGVPYLELRSDGCKAVMDDRPRDEHGLQRLCGRPQGFDIYGSRSVYCAEHTKLYTASKNPPPRRTFNG